MTQYSPIIYYPDQWRDLEEVKAIIESTKGESGFDKAADNVVQSLENVFFLTDENGEGGADEYGCERWEKILDIIPPTGATLDDRRYAIWLKSLDPRPYTWHNLNKLLDDLLGSEGQYVVERNVETKTLQIRIFLESLNQQDLVMNFLDNLVPMDIILVIGQYYNRYSELKKTEKTYTEMNNYTYEQMNSDRSIVGL